MKIWITEEPWPASSSVISEADSAGADEIWHGISAKYFTIVPQGTTGLYVLPDPEPIVTSQLDPLHVLAQAIVEATSLEDIKPVAQQILDDGIA